MKTFYVILMMLVLGSVGCKSGKVDITSPWLHIRWIDPVAGLIAVPILIAEGRKALRGETCGC